MTSALPIPTRMLVIVGVAVAALAALFVARPLLLEDSDSSAAPPAAAVTPAPTAAKPSPAPAAKPTQPKVILLPGLPTKLESKLRQSRIVVMSVYAGTDAGDRAAVAEARRGARQSTAGFAAFNVLNESTARQVQPFVGTASPPVVLIVRRPGRIVARFDGRVDETVVAQAATNAGAGSKGS
jgi:hypothetical protein